MTNSNENELKVGDAVSILRFGEWLLEKVISVDTSFNKENPFFGTRHAGGFIADEGKSWQRDIHPSLLPEGRMLVESSHLHSMVLIIEDLNKELEASKKALEFNQAAFMEQLVKFDKQSEELEAARKEIESLKGLIEFGNRNRLEIIEAYESDPFVPEGWQLVPIEPTPYMLEQSGCMDNWYGDTHEADQNHIDWWKAMLDSAPKPYAT